MTSSREEPMQNNSIASAASGARAMPVAQTCASRSAATHKDWQVSEKPLLLLAGQTGDRGCPSSS
jgi:hypothetical protein